MRETKPEAVMSRWLFLLVVAVLLAGCGEVARIDAGRSRASRSWDVTTPAALDSSDHAVTVEMPLLPPVPSPDAPEGSFALEVAAQDVSEGKEAPRVVVTVQKRQTATRGTSQDTGKEEIEARGATAEGKAVEGIEAEPPTVVLGSGGQATSGGFTVEGLVGDLRGGGMPALYWIGGLVMAAGVGVILLLKDMRSGLLVVAGGAMIAGLGALLNRYPWVTLVAGGIGALLAGFYIWQRWRAVREREALHTVVRAVEAAPEGGQVKKQVLALAGNRETAISNTITAVKRSEGLKKGE